MRKLSKKQIDTLKKHNLKNLSKAKRKEIAKKGNQASQEKRKETKTIKDIIKIFATTEISDSDIKNKLQAIGLNGTYKDYAFFILLDKAINKDNMQALNKLLDYFTIYERPNQSSTENNISDFLEMLKDTAQNDWNT